MGIVAHTSSFNDSDFQAFVGKDGRRKEAY